MIGLDYGSKRTGIAISDTNKQQAFANKTVPTKQLWHYFEILLFKQWTPDGFVIGLPLNDDGSSSKQARHIQCFSGILKKRYKLPIYFVNEHLSTHAAWHALQFNFKPLSKTKMKSEKDSKAAQIILQDFLNQDNLL